MFNSVDLNSMYLQPETVLERHLVKKGNIVVPQVLVIFLQYESFSQLQLFGDTQHLQAGKAPLMLSLWPDETEWPALEALDAAVQALDEA